MFIADNIILASRNFKTRKLRSFLTVLGISIGIGTILFLVSLGYGLQKLLIEKIATSDALLTLDISTAENSFIKINDQILQELSQMEGVKEVSPQMTVMSQLEQEELSSNVPLYAVHSSFFRLGGINFMAGQPFKEDKETKIIISSATALLLGYSEPQDALGKEVKITLIIPNKGEKEEDGSELITDNEIVSLEEKFEVSAIVDDPVTSFGFMPLGWAAGRGLENYDWIKVKVANQSQIEKTRDLIVEKGLAVSALSDTIDQANKIFNVVQVVLAIFGIVALLVSAIGMLNTMTIALLERTNEIGIMKALGATNREIMYLFITESTVIGFMGGLGGIFIGLVVATGFNYGLNLLARTLGGQSIDIFFTPIWFVLFIIIFSAGIGFITGVYPARRAAKLNALDALRYK